MMTKYRLFANLVLILGLVGCASAPRKKQPTAASGDVQREFSQIQMEVAAGGGPRAITKLKRLINQHPGTTIAQDATLLLANLQYGAHNYTASYQSYLSLVNGDTLTGNEGEALIGAAKSLAKLGRYDEALSLTERSIRVPGLNEAMMLENYRLRSALYADVGDRMDALKADVYLSEHETSPAAREAARIKGLDFVESRLNEKELQQVANDPSFGNLRGPGLFRLGALAYDGRDFSTARDDFQKVVELNVNGELTDRARQRLEQIDARRRVEPFAIGAVLPLSGKYANVGARTLRGLQLGLGIFGSDRSDFRLAVQDEEGTTDTARRAVERLVTEDHVMAIVGSLLSRTAVTVANKSEELGVPSIGLSQKAGLTDVGATVFRNSMTSQMQVRRLVRIAMDDLGLRKFAILYPNDAYGTEYATLLWDEVMARGGQITGAQVYESNETDFSPQVERLVGKFYVEDREDEYRNILKDWAKKNKVQSARHSIPDDLLPSLVQFQALFVPDGVKALGQIAPMLAYQNIKDVRLLGTNLWNTEALIQRGERHVEKALFMDGLYQNDDEFRNSRFFREFKRVYGEEPGIFEVQGYDTGLMLRQVIASGERSRSGLADKLTHLRNFPGALGPLSTNSQRELYRPLVPLTVDHGKIVRFAASGRKVNSEGGEAEE